jgi:hypothetical protein
MGSEVGKLNILRLLAATIEAIFAVCGWANIEVRQCSLSIDNWEQLVIGPIQTVLELTVDTNKLTVAITQGYRDQVRELLTLHWPISCWIFKVADIQKLVGKLARLGEGAPWIYKIMSHIYTSLAFALKQNKELLLVWSLETSSGAISLAVILRLRENWILLWKLWQEWWITTINTI